MRSTHEAGREAGLKNIWKTAGYATKETLDAIIPYLDAINVDLKGTDDEVYREYCGGTAQPHWIPSNISTAEADFEITTHTRRPWGNDRIDQLERMARFIAEEVGKEVPWHVNRFFPGWKMMDTAITPMDTLETAAAIGKSYGLHVQYRQHLKRRDSLC